MSQRKRLILFHNECNELFYYILNQLNAVQALLSNRQPSQLTVVITNTCVCSLDALENIHCVLLCNLAHFQPEIELPYFLDYSAPLFSSRPRIDRALCPGLRVNSARPRIDRAAQRN